MPTDVRVTAERGRRVFLDAVDARRGTTLLQRHGHLNLVAVDGPTDGRRSYVRVKTRTAGTWQASARDRNPASPGFPHPMFWGFVDLSRAAEPVILIVPDPEMRADIARDYNEYLHRHGGERPRNKKSLHHAIQLARIERWRDRWDLLGL